MLWLVLFSFGQTSHEDLDRQFVEIKNEIQFQDRQKIRETTAKIAKLSQSQYFQDPKRRHQRNYLLFVKTDLDTIVSLPNRDYFQLRNDMKSLWQHVESLDKDQFAESRAKINRLKTYFEKNSYFHFNLTKYYLNQYVNINRGANNFKVINDLFNEYNASKWKGHPELSFFYMAMCQDFYYQHDYNNLGLYLNQFETMLKVDYPHDHRAQFNILKFKIKALVHQEKYTEALHYYRTLDKKLLTSSERSMSLFYFHIYMHLAELFYCTNERETAREYLQKSIEKLDVYYASDKELHQELAILLRDMLASRKERDSVRSVEAHYELEPLPKLSGEK